MNASSSILLTIISKSPSLSRSAYAAPLEKLGSLSAELFPTSLNVKLPSFLRLEQWDELSEVHDKLYEKTSTQLRKIYFNKNFFLKRNFLKQIEND